MIAFAASSQSTDTICVNRASLVRMLIKAEQAKALEAQRDLLLNQVDTLKARIAIKEMQIVNLNSQIFDHKSIIDAKDKIILNQADQRKILEQNNAAILKQNRKLKRGKTWTAIAGIITTSAAVTLLILK